MRALFLVGISLLGPGCGDLRPGENAAPLVEAPRSGKHDCDDDDKPKKCKKGLTRCGCSCVNLASDPADCGACGHACLAPAGGSASCSAGACVIACPAGTRVCPGGASGVCTADPPVGAATPVTPPSSLSDAIATPGASHTYSLVAPANFPPEITQITATETPTGALDAIVTLYDPFGHAVSSSCGGSANTVAVTFTPGDSYSIVVAGVGSSTGSYTITFALAP